MKKTPDHFQYDFETTMHWYSLMLSRMERIGSDARDKFIRETAECDLFFLLVFVCKRPDIIDPWLFDRCREVQLDPDDRLDLWARGHYKDFWVDEVVATPTGWKKHGELQVGDWVYGSNGSPVRVVALSDRFTDAQCYRITFDDGYEAVCGSGHLWEVEKRTRKRSGKGRVYREKVILSTQEIAEMEHDPDKRLSIPVAPPLINIEHLLPVEPYLLGLWLGDGHSAGGRITSADDEIWKYISDLGYRLSENQRSDNTQTRNVYGMMPLLRDIGVLNNKHIPRSYAWANERQRRELLQGLMDSDGSCDSRGTATFCNQNEKLANDVFDLCQSLGLKPSLRKHKGKKKPFWHVSFQAYKADKPFRIKRKLERCFNGKRKNPRRYIISVEKVDTVETSCIQIDAADGIYLVGRNLVPTHNSTIITFGMTILDIINDPEITIGIFSHTKSIAKDFVKQIKTEFENNKDLPRLWPHIFYNNPSSASKKWSEDAFRVKRKTNPKEETVEAHGLVEGMPTGKHFGLIVYDDVVTMDSVNTPEQMQKTTEARRMSSNLGMKGGKKRRIGTRYHLFDDYADIIDTGLSVPRIHPATVDGTEFGDPVFLSEEELAEKRLDGPYVFASQQLLNPVADKAMGFRMEWVLKSDVEYTAAMSSLWRFIIVDPASRKPHGTSKKRKNDYTSMFVIGYGLDEKYRVLDIRRDRMSLTQRTDTLMELHKKWKPGLVAYEDYGMQADIEHIKYVQDQILYDFHITPIGGGMNKNLRILRLVPLFENGYKAIKDGGDGVAKSRIIFPTSLKILNNEKTMRDLVSDFFTEEYVAFPVLKHDDMIDCLSRIVDLEKMALIEKPSVAEIPTGQQRLGYKSSNKKGHESWLTA